MTNGVQATYTQASVKTANDLGTIAHSRMLREVSQLTLVEADALVDAVARLVPAGNVPGVILNGLARLKGRRLPHKIINRDINLLFKGVEQTLDRAVYGALFMGPAAVIWGYQNLLKLAGKDPESAFPEGIWQFYVNYALREDTARHTNETHGFDTALSQHHIELNLVDRITAWAMTAIHCLHQYNDLLANEWRERVYLQVMSDVMSDLGQSKLMRAWTKQRPYRRSADAGQETYAQYRRRLFDTFITETQASLTDAARRDWETRVHQLEAEDLPTYQKQMSILSYLAPGPYNETRVPYPIQQAHVGLIYQGHYTLLPVCAPHTQRPPDVSTVRESIAARLETHPQSPPTSLVEMTTLKRASWPKLRADLSPELLETLDAVRHAPILLNFDHRPHTLTLAKLRQAERGLGDHALTCLDTGTTFVFDQSHIYFDGGWGAALAEILTNEALSWAVYLNTLPLAQPATHAPHTLAIPLTTSDQAHIREMPHIIPEASAETDKVNLKALLALRKLMKRRNDLLRLTVNDILILYRAIHALTYRPTPLLVTALQHLTSDQASMKAAQAALEALETRENPAILIPVAATQAPPRDRLYPMTFEVPIADMDLLHLHQQTLEALDVYQHTAGDRGEAYTTFDHLQRAYLGALAGFGQVCSRAKEIANAGESASVGSVKLLAHMPAPLQQMLDRIPSRFDILNDIIKGREVFSNLGAVAPNSTLTRFITAKDDNDKKTLAWGVITDAQTTMRISLRDFRPHVALLQTCEQSALATHIAQDYLDAYAHGLNKFIRDVQHITLASRETRLAP